MFAFLNDRLFFAQQEVTLGYVPLSDARGGEFGGHRTQIVFYHNVVPFLKDADMKRLAHRQLIVLDGVFHQQLETDRGNLPAGLFQPFIHINAYGVLIAHPYQVDVGTQESQFLAYRTVSRFKFWMT